MKTFETRFKGNAIQADVVRFASGFSPDRQAVTLIFDNLQVGVGGKQGPLVSTQTVTIALPIESENQEVHLTQDIRGFVDTSRLTRAVLVVQAAGATTVVNLQDAKDKGDSLPETGNAVLEAREQAREQAKAFAKNNEPVSAADFCQRITGALPAGAGYQVTLFLLVERDAKMPDAEALLIVDSLDIEISKV